MSCGCLKHCNIMRLQRDTFDQAIVQNVGHFCWKIHGFSFLPKVY